ncbi:hypothetical protein SNE40_005190 [Patella caerulea]|uniref:Uncharacterized protein n=1 Tax=Patella caerulea TaxID=87958 RepID=A0AAN8PW07_PATCE
MESQRDRSSDYSQRLITRAFYQYIQCLHHLANLAEPSTCFKKKENELNRFIRPARSNPEIVNKIHEINAEWSAKIRYELRQHYQEQLYWSLENVADHHYNHTGEQVMDMGHRALAWAKKNYGKRLRQQTIDTFLMYLPSALPTPPQSPVSLNSTSPIRLSPVPPSPKPQRKPRVRSPKPVRSVSPPIVFSVKPVPAPPTGKSKQPIRVTALRTPSKKVKAPPTRVASPSKRNKIIQKPKTASASRPRLPDTRSKLVKPAFIVPNRFSSSTKNTDPFTINRPSNSRRASAKD